MSLFTKPFDCVLTIKFPEFEDPIVMVSVDSILFPTLISPPALRINSPPAAADSTETVSSPEIVRSVSAVIEPVITKAPWFIKETVSP